jgi:outer membrane protein assembly factor BamB
VKTLVVGICLAVSALAVGADWPQWHGPDRTGVSKETGLLQSWPKQGPPLLWTYKDLGIGFSGPAIIGDRLYTMGARNEFTYVIAIDINKGSEVWSQKFGPIFTQDAYGDGPRSTPTIDGDYLYALDGTGELVCLETAKGKEIWRKNLIKNLGGEIMLSPTKQEWGYSESVLIDGDKLICTPGGEKGTLAALDKKTGAVLWRSTELKNKAPYSSAVVAEIDGVRQYIQNSFLDGSGAVCGFAANDGKLLWKGAAFEGEKYGVAQTPVIHSNLVYTTSGYGDGCHLFQLTTKGKTFAAKDIYPKTVQRRVKNAHGGMILVGNYLYGHANGVGWVCQDFKSGKTTWIDRTKLVSKSGSIMAVEDRLYLYNDTGTAVLLQADSKSWKEHGRFEIPEKSKVPQSRKTSRSAGIWTHPVVANGRLYLRDQELLFCYDVREKK